MKHDAVQIDDDDAGARWQCRRCLSVLRGWSNEVGCVGGPAVTPTESMALLIERSTRIMSELALLLEDLRRQAARALDAERSKRDEKG